MIQENNIIFHIKVYSAPLFKWKVFILRLLESKIELVSRKNDVPPEVTFNLKGKATVGFDRFLLILEIPKWIFENGNQDNLVRLC